MIHEFSAGANISGYSLKFLFLWFLKWYGLLIFLLTLWLLLFMPLHGLFVSFCIITLVPLILTLALTSLFLSLSYTQYLGDFIHYYDFRGHLLAKNSKFYIFRRDISNEF